MEPKIPPGYAPQASDDERGIWIQLEDYEDAIKRSAVLLRDGQVRDYVQDVMCRVAGEYCGDLRIYVIRNPYFNASMGANGMVQVWTGLLLRVSNEHELAAVLGHELAHYTQLHSLERLRSASRAMSAGLFLDLGLALATGVGLPLAQLAGLSSVMAFSRSDETEADLLGVDFMARAGYDPTAAAHVWQMIVNEEEKAETKSKKTNIFTSTHPSSSSRISRLQRYVAEQYPEMDSGAFNANRHLEILSSNYAILMEDQIDTNRFGRTEAILQGHREMGVAESMLNFFYGEMYRQRAEPGDLELALDAYIRATESEPVMSEAYRNLGYIYLKKGDKKSAQENFRSYLEHQEDATDRAMIEFYLEDE